MEAEKSMLSNSAQPAKGFIPKICWSIIILVLGVLFVAESHVVIACAEDKNDFALPSSWSDYSNGQWQKDIEHDLLTKHAMRSLVKVKNELDYQVFNQINVENFIYGRDGYVFSEPAIAATFGDDFIGEKAVKEYVRKTRDVQDSLKKYGVDFMVMYAPEKSIQLEDVLPESVRKFKHRRTNYEAYTFYGKMAGLHVLDFNAYFNVLKNKIPYQIYGRTGSHWSYYTECLAVDSTIQFIEKLTGENLPNLTIREVESRQTYLYRDGDIQDKCPRLSSLPPENLAYPGVLDYSGDTAAHTIRTLCIGDSYYQCFAYTHALEQAFDTGGYWYYFNTEKNGKHKGSYVCELDLRSELLSNRVVILQTNVGNLTSFGNGFIDDTYLMFHKPKVYELYVIKKREMKLGKSYKKTIPKEKK